jgi:hypothetical protein
MVPARIQSIAQTRVARTRVLSVVMRLNPIAVAILSVRELRITIIVKSTAVLRRIVVTATAMPVKTSVAVPQTVVHHHLLKPIVATELTMTVMALSIVQTAIAALIPLAAVCPENPNVPITANAALIGATGEHANSNLKRGD